MPTLIEKVRVMALTDVMLTALLLVGRGEQNGATT